MDHDRYKKALQFLDSIGLRLLQDKELEEIAKAYQRDLLNGLTHKQSSLQMLFTGLTVSDRNLLYSRRSAFIIEIGGTNICAAHIIVDQDNKLVIRNDTKYKGKLGKTVFHNTDDFFEEIISHIDFLLQNEIPHAFGIIYSFPGTAIQTSYGIDIVSSNKLPKDFIIPGIEKDAIERLFINVLKQKYDIPDDTKIVVLNDTSAVLLSDIRAAIGGVLGTGFNVAIAIDKKIINSESGGFSQIPQYQISQYIDEQSTNRGKQLAEKQISGLYLGLAFQMSVTFFVQEKLVKSVNSQLFTPEHMSEILQNGRVPFIADETDNQILKQTAEKLTARSSQIVGTMIGTIIKTKPENFIDNTITIPMEGSVFWGMPHYCERTKKIAEKIIPDKTITFLNIENAGMIGAARAVLS